MSASLVNPQTANPTCALFSPTPARLNPTRWTGMVWAYHIGGTAAAYSDLISVRDGVSGQVFGLTSIVTAGVRKLNLGDLGTDTPGTTTIPDNEWHHCCVTINPTTGGNVIGVGYLDGRTEIPSATLAPPTDLATLVLALINSRESTTDNGAVWTGQVAAVKIWNDVVLSPVEVLREMKYYTPQRSQNIYAWSPMASTDHRTNVYGGLAAQDWTTRGSVVAGGWTAATLDPPGVVWDNPLAPRRATRKSGTTKRFLLVRN